MSEYGWIIDVDYLADDEGSNVGVMGPRDIPSHIEAGLLSGEGKVFRIIDDDGEKYYRGRYIGPDNEDMFGPLWDYAQPGAGATDIQYPDEATGKRWVTL